MKEYISVINSSNINSIIKNLKTVDLKTFEEGYITEITGNIPFFEIDYELNLKDDFNRLGIKDIFDINKTNLSNITNEQAYIRDSQNKTIINFSNDGIKAASAISYYGGGAGDCGFDYEFEVPVKTIYLTFDKPYLFLVRDKTTNEVWFTGTVYEPMKEYPEEYWDY